MESIDNLQTFSELYIALIGFTGIVTAIKFASQAPSLVRRIQMTGLFGIGLVGIVLAILPQVLFSAHLEEQSIWRYLSVVFLLILSVVLTARMLQLINSGASVLAAGYVVLVPVTLMWLSLAANIFVATAWLYMLALLCHLTAGLILFGTLLLTEDTDLK